MADEIKVTLSKAEGVTLATKNKICERNIKVSLDSESLANLIPENIKKGVTILGVTGTNEGRDTNVYLRYNGKVVQTIDTEYNTTWEIVGQDGAAYGGYGSDRIVVYDNGGSIIGDYAEFYIKDGDTYVTADYGILVGGSYFDLELTEDYAPAETTTATFYQLPYGGTSYSKLGTYTTNRANPSVSVSYDDENGTNSVVTFSEHTIIGGTAVDNIEIYDSTGTIVEGELTAGETYTFYLVFESDEFINPNEVETPTTTVHFLWNDGRTLETVTTGVEKPYIYGDSGNGIGVGLYCGPKVVEGYDDLEPEAPPIDDYFYMYPESWFIGFATQQNGTPFCGSAEWYALTAGETYTFYVRIDGDYVDVGGGDSCTHTNVRYEYNAEDGGMHNVYCDDCGEYLHTEVCDGDPCSKCGYASTCSHGNVEYTYSEEDGGMHHCTCNYCGAQWTEVCDGDPCSKCGHTEGGSSGGGGTTSCDHTYVGETVIEPTCTSTGTIQYICSKCSAFSHSETIPALGHNMVDSDGDGQATCTRCGSEA